MTVLDYNTIRDQLTAVIEETGLQISVEESVVVTSLLRECTIHIFPAIDGPDVWGKVTFEWDAENQAILDEYIRAIDFDLASTTDFDPDINQIIVHSEFHMHFGGLAINSEAVSGVAQSIKQLADGYFSGNGRVIAEVYMDAENARIDCLRYEKHSMCTIITDEPWWEQWGIACQGMLAHMAEIYARLESVFGPQRN